MTDSLTPTWEPRIVLQMLVASDDAAQPRGIMDCVDNDGKPYQSAHMAKLVEHARALVSAPTTIGERQAIAEGVLRARIAELESEVADRDARDEIVTALAGGLDAIDFAADKWVELTEVRRSTQAIASVFAQWASDDVMQRFINSIVDLQHLAFGEGYYIAHEVATPATNAPVADREAAKGPANIWSDPIARDALGLALQVTRRAQEFCAELQEDAEGVPAAELKALHAALDRFEALDTLGEAVSWCGGSPNDVGQRVAEIMAEGDGHWTPCTGCQESVDGCVSNADYPYDPTFKCQPGGGCGECGGIGVTWTPAGFYDGIAEWSQEQDRTHTNVLAALDKLVVINGAIVGKQTAADAILALRHTGSSS